MLRKVCNSCSEVPVARSQIRLRSETFNDTNMESTLSLCKPVLESTRLAQGECT